MILSSKTVRYKNITKFSKHIAERILHKLKQLKMEVNEII